jgi:hypothetical protein
MTTHIAAQQITINELYSRSTIFIFIIKYEFIFYDKDKVKKLLRHFYYL